MTGDWCETCQNTGDIDCYCGGDLCVCGGENGDGTDPCPTCCGGERRDDDEEAFDLDDFYQDDDQ